MADDLGIIRIFTLDDSVVRINSELRYPSNRSDGPGLVVVKMAFSFSGWGTLAVIYRRLEQVSEPSPLYRQAKSERLTVAIYWPQQFSSSGGICHTSEAITAFKIWSPPDAECVGLAIAPNGTICLGWHKGREEDETEIWFCFGSGMFQTMFLISLTGESCKGR